MLTTYHINCTDTDHPTPWHDAPGIVSAVAAAQDSGNCAWIVVTTDSAALEEALEADDAVLAYESDAPGQRYRIQTDEETGGDVIWDALHSYAQAHPAPAALAPFVDRNVLGDFNGVVVDQSAGESALAWLAAAAEALNWDEQTTPVIVTPENVDDDDDDDDDEIDADGDCVRCGHPANGSSGHGTCDGRAHR